MSKYLFYKPSKNCAEIPNGCHNIAVSLGGLFWHPEVTKHFGKVFFISSCVLLIRVVVNKVTNGRCVTFYSIITLCKYDITLEINDHKFDGLQLIHRSRYLKSANYNFVPCFTLNKKGCMHVLHTSAPKGNILNLRYFCLVRHVSLPENLQFSTFAFKCV